MNIEGLPDDFTSYVTFLFPSCLSPPPSKDLRPIAQTTLGRHRRLTKRGLLFSSLVLLHTLPEMVIEIPIVVIEQSLTLVLGWAFLEQLTLASIDVGRLDVADVSHGLIAFCAFDLTLTRKIRTSNA